MPTNENDTLLKAACAGYANHMSAMFGFDDATLITLTKQYRGQLEKRASTFRKKANAFKETLRKELKLAQPSK